MTSIASPTALAHRCALCLDRAPFGSFVDLQVHVSSTHHRFTLPVPVWEEDEDIIVVDAPLPPAPSYCGPACACTCADDCFFCDVCQQSEADSRESERRYWERYAAEHGGAVYIPQG